MERGETRLSDEAGVSALIDELARGRFAIGAKAGLTARLDRDSQPRRPDRATHRRNASPTSVPVGALDITLYRDDLGRGNRWPVLKGTEIPFAVDGAEVVLVDDVLYTGRTVRAAIDCVCDLGRPSSVRSGGPGGPDGGRELPIQADYAGLIVPVQAGERVDGSI